MRKPYRRRTDQAITAVQLKLEFDELIYEKWGSTQRARQGDWLVDNNGDVYTVSAASFAETYRQVKPGRWLKITPVWAEQTMQAGSVATQEGRTHYQAGDWLVCNREDGGDAYAIDAETFESLYEPVDS